MLAKQQAQAVSGTKRASPYPYVQSRINTGIPKHQTIQVDPRLTKNLRVVGPAMHDAHKRYGRFSLHLHFLSKMYFYSLNAHVQTGSIFCTWHGNRLGADFEVMCVLHRFVIFI